MYNVHCSTRSNIRYSYNHIYVGIDLIAGMRYCNYFGKYYLSIIQFISFYYTIFIYS